MVLLTISDSPNQKKAKIIERKDIPSYEAMTDDMARVQIQEFWNQPPP